MKILIIGGSGTIGRKLASAFSDENTVIPAGRTTGDVHVDISDAASVRSMFDHTGVVDALICTAGEAVWKPLSEMTDEDFHVGIRSKLMGQVNLVRHGQDRLADNGSITLTTGVLADEPVLNTTSAAMVNGAIHSFVKAAALEMPRGIRINAVCPDLVEDSAERYGDFFPGHAPVPMEKVVKAYKDCLEGTMTGNIVRVMGGT